jgi:hypothetical protein
MTAPVPGWYPDPANPQLLRWWDGYAWTPHAQPNPAAAQPQPYQFHPGQPPVQAGQPAAPQPATPAEPQPGAAGQVGAGPLFTDPTFQVIQGSRDLGMLETTSYQILGQTGQPIGSIQQIRLEAPDAQRRLFSTPDAGYSQSEHYQVLDHTGALLLHVGRSLKASSAHRPRFDVTTADGQPIGTIESEKLVGRITFGFTVGGARVAGVKAEGMRNRQFPLTDQQGQQFARYDREPPNNQREDMYTVTRFGPTPEPLGTFVLTALIALDAGFFAATVGGVLR